MPIEPCHRCGGSGEAPMRQSLAVGQEGLTEPCPRCEGMPKLPATGMGWFGGEIRSTDEELAIRGQAYARGWFFPDPDTVMWWCDYHLSRFLNGDTCVMAEQIYEFGLCDPGWVARPVRLETVEAGSS